MVTNLTNQTNEDKEKIAALMRDEEVQNIELGDLNAAQAAKATARLKVIIKERRQVKSELGDLVAIQARIGHKKLKRNKQPYYTYRTNVVEEL